MISQASRYNRSSFNKIFKKDKNKFTCDRVCRWFISRILEKKSMKLQTSFSVPMENMGDIGRKHKAIKRGMTAIASYWEKECALNPSSPACLIFED